MDLVELARRIVARHESVAACRQGLADVFQARAMLDSFEVALVNDMQVYAVDEGNEGLFCEQVIAEATRGDLCDAVRLQARSATIDEIGELAEVLAKGTTTGDHVDAVAAAMRGLKPDERRKVHEIGPKLAEAAASQTKRQFRNTAKRLIDAATADPGLDRLTEQKRRTRLQFGVAADSGMWWFRGQLDPETGARVEPLIRRAVEQLFAARIPDHCPDDALDKQHFLQAHALVHLLAQPTGDRGSGDLGGGGGERVDLSVLVDWKTLVEGAHEGSICELGLSDFGLPAATISRWACCADITPVVVAPDGQRIMLGRTVRLANRAQRRALKALYTTCALCDTPFEHTQAHHVAWYTLGGMTDITNLVPLCGRHHHLVHEGGWHLAIAADRSLTLTAPDRTQTWIPPPRIAA